MRELRELFAFLNEQISQDKILGFCSSQGIEWSFIPEHAPHFGGLWESTVKSVKVHLRKVLGESRLNFGEYNTVLAQIEACLNSRPLVSLTCYEDGLEALTPGHFLIGRPLEALPDSVPITPLTPVPLLRRWNLCQLLTRHFWKRWSTDYFASLRKYTKWHTPSRNLQIGDLVLLKEDGIIPSKWPLGRIVSIYPGDDKLVRVVTVKTLSGVYRRPAAKVALLLENSID